MNGMRQAKKSHNNITHVYSVLISRNARDAIARCTCTSGECERLAYCQHGEVNIRFSHIEDLAAEVLVHHLRGNTLVLDVGIIVDIDTVGLPCYGFQKRGTTAARRYQYNSDWIIRTAYLPGLPRTTNISPDLTNPSKSRKI